MSGGQRQALALGIAFASEPTLVLLDEPPAGLAPPVARDLFRSIGELAAGGTAVLLAEQHPVWLKGLANRCYLLEIGSVAEEGSVEQMIRRTGADFADGSTADPLAI